MKIGRNDPCHCGSGQKYKKCCLAKDDAARSAELAVQAAQALAAGEGEEEATTRAGERAAAARAQDVAAAKPKPAAQLQPPPIRRRAV